MTVLFVALYVLFGCVAFVGVAYMLGELRDPWDGPAPFFCGLMWPLALPFLVSTLICKRLDKHLKARVEREDELKRRIEELEREMAQGKAST